MSAKKRRTDSEARKLPANNGTHCKERERMFPFFFFNLKKQTARSVPIRFIKISDISVRTAVIRKCPNNQKGGSEYATECIYL